MIGGDFILKQLHFDNFEELACDIFEQFENINEEYKCVSVIAKYNEAKEIIKELLHIGCKIVSVALHTYMYEYYDNEYIISISNVDVKKGIWCEKFKREKGYFHDESDISYILDNCSSKVIRYCQSDLKYEVSIENDDYEDEVEDKDDIHGFTLSNTDDNGYRSFSYYTTNSLTEEDIQSMIEKMGFSFSK